MSLHSKKDLDGGTTALQIFFPQGTSGLKGETESTANLLVRLPWEESIQMR